MQASSPVRVAKTPAGRIERECGRELPDLSQEVVIQQHTRTCCVRFFERHRHSEWIVHNLFFLVCVRTMYYDNMFSMNNIVNCVMML